MKWVWYGIGLGLLWWIVDSIQYSFAFRTWSVEWKFGLIAALFFGLGIWMRKKDVPTTEPEYQPIRNTVETDLLSEREKEVLVLLAAGHTNAEIADKLFVSSNTIKTHLSNLYLKLDVSRRTQAVQKARELGILKEFH